MRSLTWEQVNAWRLAQQHLSRRLERADFLDAARRTVGIQAQVLSAAELALWARVDGLMPEDIRSALWEKRTLIKTWAMRTTLHLIATDELPLIVAARSAHDNRNWEGYFKYFDISIDEFNAFVDAVPELMGNQAMTREGLASAVGAHLGAPKLRDLIMDANWGTPLKVLALRGQLCFGPSSGQNVTFVNARTWMGGTWETFDPEEALLEVARRYLRAYGPSTTKDFVLWWWGGSAAARSRQVFKDLGDEVETVDVEGWQGIALRVGVDDMLGMVNSNTVNLLPLFDAYTLGLPKDVVALLPKAYKKRVYRPQGWISAVVLLDGTIKGVWEYKTKRKETAVTVKLFNASASEIKRIKRGLEGEVERLGAFLNTPVVVDIQEET